MRDRNIPVIFLFISLFLSISLFQPVSSQSSDSAQIRISERLYTLAKNAPHELAYIQTSKDIYEKGEDLWFKVYILDAQNLMPSELSLTLYLQLQNEITGKVVWQEKYEIQKGFANGQVYLGSDLPEGDYLLEAFTTDSFFDDTTEFRAVRRIKVKTDIISPETSEVSKNINEPYVLAKPVKPGLIQFNTFPEGGILVSGIPGRLAFKAVNSSGEPVDIKGTLFEDSVPILKFNSRHAGMGTLTFTPDISKKYIIRLSDPPTDSLFLLPEIYTAGITMQLIVRDEESLSFLVSKSPGHEPEDIYLRVQCRGVVYGVANGKLNSDVKIKLPLSDLPQGIAEVTLFNSKLEPVAERLVYVNKDQKLNITAGLSKEIFYTRGNATLKIKVKDEYGDPVVANLGVSIFDKLYQNPGDSVNILNHYYLSTQLKGRIYNPSYYFSEKNKDRIEALDLLLLTQGWRKYEWNESNLEKYRDALYRVITDGINGRLIVNSIWKKTRSERLFVMSYCPNKDKKKLLIAVDSSKVFTVPPDQLKKGEGDYVYLKPFWSHKYPPPLKMDDPFETINRIMNTKEVSYPLQCLSTPVNEIPDVSVSQGVNVISDVTIKGKKSKVIRGKYMGQLDSIAKFDLNTDYVCRFEVLNCPNHSRNEEGTIKPVQGGWYYLYLGYGTPNARLIPTMYVMPSYSEEEILKLHFLSRVKGYYANRRFYQPDYDKESDLEKIPDFRNTLLWEPSVITDEKGEATLSFFCSDINSDFVGRIEGVGGEGLLGAGYFKFTVRKLQATP